jgi:superfamily II DNA or RNA helicase
MSLRDHPYRIFYGPADDPLHNFYIPALAASVRYDRATGFFSSSALAVAAAGVARLIQNGGRMRLLVGADLRPDDVDAIRQGHALKERVAERMLAHFPDPEDALLRQRLEVLAWMVAEGTLEIRVVLPRGKDGLPIPADQARDYYHPKTGLFTDGAGNQIAFSGSVNESETGWKQNYELLAVYFSWNETRGYLAQVKYNFEQVWTGKEPNWIALDVPHAVRERLLCYRPATAPKRDPLERPERPAKDELEEYLLEPTIPERITFQYLRDAPHLPNAIELGATTAALDPWPHQSRVARSILERFPERAMLCDEVGLGKTIEAGLVVRQLLIAGRIRRCLILTPKSVLKQWQEELYEKFALEVPRYDAGTFWDVQDVDLGEPAGNPWDAHPVMLASSQLAKRKDRRDEILAARGWDLLLVDEAHHARRKDFLQRQYRPNRLLGLLNELRDRVGSLILMTATPMQIHALEVWDLLTVLGMGGRWGADEDAFLDFFEEMRKPISEIEWDFVFEMVGDALQAGGEIDPAFRSEAERAIGLVQWLALSELPYKQHPARIVNTFSRPAKTYAYQMARRHTPINRYVYRSTRELLREYERRGIMKARVPRRAPKLVRIAMRPEELALYERIEEYISHFYQKYESERRGLGFVMTVYRRRLTSSFYAVRESLERRLRYLRGQIGIDDTYLDDDLEQDELEMDVSEQVLSEADQERFAAEVEYVEDFIQDLNQLSVADSKLEQLKDELNQLFRQRSTVLVFTQYTDTMDYLRDQLVEVYGSQVACYSGRGGEVWNGLGWADTTKEEVKNRFREGQIRILLCTESASEGLNLQTCGVLINYDMPWNPMRVEQRIGRIDRIGQQYEQVWISNYFYRDTIEDRIYQRLSDRIDWFEVVVGDLQPILAEVGDTTRRLAMLPAGERAARFDEEIAKIDRRLQAREFEGLNLDNFLVAERYEPGPASPVSLDELRNRLVGSRGLGWRFEPHPAIEAAYLLDWEGARLPVTFSPRCFDAHPDTVRFLSYGSPLLGALLASVAAPESASGGRLVRCCSDGDVRLCRWYRPGADGRPEPVETLADLEARLAADGADGPAVPDLEAQALSLFEAEVVKAAGKLAAVIGNQRQGRYLAERARAQALLLRAAAVEIALGKQPNLFEDEAYPAAFNEQAVLGLARHRFPWAPLVQLAFQKGLAPSESDPYYQDIANSPRDSLRGRFAQLQKEAQEAVKALNAAKQAAEARPEAERAAIGVEVFAVGDQH